MQTQSHDHINPKDNNNHHIENESLLSNEESTFNSPTIQKVTNNKNQKINGPPKNAINNENQQNEDLHHSNDIQSENIEKHGNKKIEKKLNDNSKSGFLDPPFQHIRDLDKGKELYSLSGMSPLKTVCYISIGLLVNH